MRGLHSGGVNLFAKLRDSDLTRRADACLLWIKKRFERGPTSGGAPPVVSFAHLPVECSFNKFYGIDWLQVGCGTARSLPSSASAGLPTSQSPDSSPVRRFPALALSQSHGRFSS